MRVALTGHTSGIGKEIYETFVDGKRVIVPFSKSNNYDITSEKSRKEIADTVEELNCDVFINNAQDGDGQTAMLLEMYKKWRGQSDKQIINIGSIATDNIPCMSDKMIPYLAKKASLHHAILQLQKQIHHCRIVNIRFGFVDTPLVEGLLDKNKHGYLTVHEAYLAIMSVIDSPFYIREIAVTGPVRYRDWSKYDMPSTRT